MSLEHSPVRAQKTTSTVVSDPSYTVAEFCALERVSRSMLYRAWKEGWGPRYFMIGVSRRISHRARIEWQDQREAEVAAGEAKK